MNKKRWISLVLVALIAIIAVPIYYTFAWFSGQAQATGTITLKNGIAISYSGLSTVNNDTFLILNENSTGTYSGAAPGDDIDVTQVQVWQSNKGTTTDAVLRFKLSYYYSTDGSTYSDAVNEDNVNLHIETPISVDSTKFIKSGDWYYYVSNVNNELNYTNLATLGNSENKLSIFNNLTMTLDSEIDPNYYIKIQIEFDAVQNNPDAVTANNWFAA